MVQSWESVMMVVVWWTSGAGLDLSWVFSREWKDSSRGVCKRRSEINEDAVIDEQRSFGTS